MDEPKKHWGQFDPLDAAPVIVCEHTATGWRGLTEDGEIFNVHAHVNGAPVLIPDRLAVMQGDLIVGHRAVNNEPNDDGVIADYIRHLDAATALLRQNDPERALAEIDVALVCARTALARYNRAMILLHLGRWQEGFDEFAYCEMTSPLFMRPQYADAIKAGLKPWLGEDIAGKKLLLIHDHGFGDSIMGLRFVSQLHDIGAEVVLQMPPALERLAAQIAPVTRDLVDADYVCSILLLTGLIADQCFRYVGKGGDYSFDEDGPYLQVQADLRDKWREYLGAAERKRIGIAWSVGVPHGDDYPRSIPLGQMCRALEQEGSLFAVQQMDEQMRRYVEDYVGPRRSGYIAPDEGGVRHYFFDDFADCAAFMSCMDEIVTVDTAAAHLAGAIGHPRVTLLLSHWASWRWQLPLYPNVRICRQDRPGDWESAFAARHFTNRLAGPAG
jgi:hypothetical protein